MGLFGTHVTSETAFHFYLLYAETSECPWWMQKPKIHGFLLPNHFYSKSLSQFPCWRGYTYLSWLSISLSLPNSQKHSLFCVLGQFIANRLSACHLCYHVSLVERNFFFFLWYFFLWSMTQCLICGEMLQKLRVKICPEQQQLHDIKNDILMSWEYLTN